MNTAGKYLISGATGFLGRHLLRAIFTENASARPQALVRSARRWREQPWLAELGGSVGVVEGEVETLGPWADDPALDGTRGIFHLAALVRHSRKDPEEVYRTNVEGTLNMVRLASRRRCRLVFVSTSGTVGCGANASDAPDESAPRLGDEVRAWPYYDSKVRAEEEAETLARRLGVELVIVRPPVLLGPGDHRFRSTNLVIKMLRRKLPFLIRGGMHFTDIRDAARAIARIVTLEKPRPVYHLPGTACEIAEFFRMLEEVSGVRAPRFHLPYGAAHRIARAGYRAGELLRGEPLTFFPDPVVVEMGARYWNFRSSHSEADLGYRPRDSRETLRDTVGWLRANHPRL